MMNRIVQAVFFVVILAVTVTIPAHAEAEFPPDAARVTGKVLHIDLEQKSLSIRLRSGRRVAIHTSSETQFHDRNGDLHQLDQISPGMWVIASGQIHEGKFVAKRIIFGGVGDQKQSFNAAGEITSIIPGQGTFEMTTRTGESIWINVTERTRFRSRDGSIDSIEDLKKDMIAGVRGVIDERGVHLATVIVAGEREDLPPAADRAVGRIVHVDEQDFTLQIRAGGIRTIVGGEHTAFRSRDGSIQGFEDLQPGMFAIVVGKDLGSDQMEARWIAAWMPESQEPSDRTPERTELQEPDASDLMSIGPGR